VVELTCEGTLFPRNDGLHHAFSPIYFLLALFREFLLQLNLRLDLLESVDTERISEIVPALHKDGSPLHDGLFYGIVPNAH
jgi:hypothetical protein